MKIEDMYTNSNVVIKGTIKDIASVKSLIRKFDFYIHMIDDPDQYREAVYNNNLILDNLKDFGVESIELESK
jgi:hypothetical protein